MTNTLRDWLLAGTVVPMLASGPAPVWAAGPSPTDGMVVAQAEGPGGAGVLRQRGGPPQPGGAPPRGGAEPGGRPPQAPRPAAAGEGEPVQRRAAPTAEQAPRPQPAAPRPPVEAQPARRAAPPPQAAPVQGRPAAPVGGAEPAVARRPAAVPAAAQSPRPPVPTAGSTAPAPARGAAQSAEQPNRLRTQTGATPDQPRAVPAAPGRPPAPAGVPNPAAVGQQRVVPPPGTAPGRNAPLAPATAGAPPRVPGQPAVPAGQPNPVATGQQRVAPPPGTAPGRGTPVAPATAGAAPRVPGQPPVPAGQPNPVATGQQRVVPPLGTAPGRGAPVAPATAGAPVPGTPARAPGQPPVPAAQPNPVATGQQRVVPPPGTAPGRGAPLAPATAGAPAPGQPPAAAAQPVPAVTQQGAAPPSGALPGRGAPLAPATAGSPIPAQGQPAAPGAQPNPAVTGQQRVVPQTGTAPGQAAGAPIGALPPPPPPEAARVPGQARLPDQQGRRQGSGAGAVAVGAAAGFVGGFLAAQGVERLDDVRSRRQEFNDDGVDIIREPGRTIIQEDDRIYVAHDENERFRDLGYDVRSEREGDYDVAVFDRPDGSRVLTYTDEQGRLVRRVRQYPDGRQIYLINDSYGSPDRDFRRDVVELPPPPDELPPERYVVDAGTADESAVYDALVAPPVAPLPQRYTLDQVRYSPTLRARMRSVDVNTVTFASGSWTVPPNQVGRLSVVAQAINQAVTKNPQEVFMVEGHTDAVGSAVDNVSLSDRRAQSVAAILTQNFQVPPENLVTQGYGAQYLKVQTQGASADNRRVTVRRITPLLSQQQAQQGQ